MEMTRQLLLDGRTGWSEMGMPGVRLLSESGLELECAQVIKAKVSSIWGG